MRAAGVARRDGAQPTRAGARITAWSSRPRPRPGPALPTESAAQTPEPGGFRDRRWAQVPWASPVPSAPARNEDRQEEPNGPTPRKPRPMCSWRSSPEPKAPSCRSGETRAPADARRWPRTPPWRSRRPCEGRSRRRTGGTCRCRRRSARVAPRRRSAGQLPERPAERVPPPAVFSSATLMRNPAVRASASRAATGRSPGLAPGAHVRAGMDDHARKAERLLALELVGERVDGMCPRDWVRAGEIDEIARVGEDAPDAGPPPCRAER